MKADFCRPRIPPAGLLFDRTKSIQKFADTHGFGLPFIPPPSLAREPWGRAGSIEPAFSIHSTMPMAERRPSVKPRGPPPCRPYRGLKIGPFYRLVSFRNFGLIGNQPSSP